MTRTRQVPRAEVPASILPVYERLFGDRDPVTDPGTATGTPGNWWSVFAQTPALLDHMVAGFGLFSSPERSLPASLRELALTRTGSTAQSQFVFSQHCKAARAAGLSERCASNMTMSRNVLSKSLPRTGAATTSWAPSPCVNGAEQVTLSR